jgi:hypothetical protein
VFFFVLRHKCKNPKEIIPDDEIEKLECYGTVEVFRPEEAEPLEASCATQKLRPCFGIDNFLKARKKVSRSPEQLQIVVGQEAAEVVALKPIVEVNLIEVRSNDFFAQCVGLSAQEWDS